jgi:hypothetical protein
MPKEPTGVNSIIAKSKVQDSCKIPTDSTMLGIGKRDIDMVTALGAIKEETIIKANG